jgi:uncharacterized phage protein (TIGR02220 family)
MALRNQPYIPLYVQDIMTDEKLNECSASTHGIYIKGIMCLMHKSENYGMILLKQNYKQTNNFCLDLSLQLTKHLPYSAIEIQTAIEELIREKVCYIENDFLCQKRMIKDNLVSEARSNAGKKGGGNPNFVNKLVKTNLQTNTENVNINKDIIKNIIEYLNKKIGTTFKENSIKTVNCITARLNENFTYDDFVLVIDYKAKEWKNTDFEKFLRPETLFGNKFEGYLQASKITINNQNNISNDRKGKSSFEIIKSLGENFK